MEPIPGHMKAKVAGLCALIVIAAAVFGWNGLLKPKAELIGKLAVSRANEIERNKYFNSIAEDERKLLAYKKYLSKTQDSSWLIDFVNRVAGETGLSLGSVSPEGAGADLEAYPKISLRIETHCGFHELGEFISRIESAPTLIRINYISMRPSDILNPSKGLDVSMSLQTLYAAGAV